MKVKKRTPTTASPEGQRPFVFQLLTPDGESLTTPCPHFMFQELSTPGLCAFSSACCPQPQG